MEKIEKYLLIKASLVTIDFVKICVYNKIIKRITTVIFLNKKRITIVIF